MDSEAIIMPYTTSKDGGLKIYLYEAVNREAGQTIISCSGLKVKEKIEWNLLEFRPDRVQTHDTVNAELLRHKVSLCLDSHGAPEQTQSVTAFH